MTRRVVDLVALDVPIRITAQDGGLLDDVAATLTDLVPFDRTSDSRTVLIQIAGLGPWRITSEAHSAEALTREQAVSQVHAAVNLSAVAATSLLAFHCAVLAHGGRTLVLPGRSGMGKTTLTAALLLSGWDYVSDEALALPWVASDPVPYPRPLGLSTWSRSTLAIKAGLAGEAEYFVRPAHLGAQVQRHPGPVTHVVVADPGVPAFSGPVLEPIKSAEVLAAMLYRAFTVHREAGRALEVLGDLLRAALTYRLTLGPPAETAALVTAAIASP